MRFDTLTRMCHWGPLITLGIIKCITLTSVHCGNIWWPPTESTGGLLFLANSLILWASTLYTFLTAMFDGPGYLPLLWEPEDVKDSKNLQFCQICRGYKAPRAHHCRKCGRCVMKMDHHCPWINNCVGHSNHGHFIAFLCLAVLSCVQASVLLARSLYQAVYLETLNTDSLVFWVISLILSIVVTRQVGKLLASQVRVILRNRTAIESLVMEKANHRRYVDGDPLFVFPYDLGRGANLLQVLNLTCTPVGDGIVWPVVEGCDQYTLTLEEQRQKSSHRQVTRLHRAVSHFSGRWFPVVHGWRVCCHPPFADDPRMSLQPGDRVLVTRWRRYWLYGEKVQQGGSDVPQVKGWFPSVCTVEVEEEHNYTDQKNK